MSVSTDGPSGIATGTLPTVDADLGGVTHAPPAGPIPSSAPIVTPTDAPAAALDIAPPPLATPTRPVVSPRSTRPRRASVKVLENAEAGPSRSSPRTGAFPKSPAQPPKSKREMPDLKPREPYLQPHHFSGMNNGARPPTSLRSRWEPIIPGAPDLLSPEDDPMALRGIPVFHPTMKEFKDFEAYVTRTVPWGMRSGIVKVVPPAEWTSTLPPMDRRTLSEVQIKRPIQQNMMGSAGIYRATNIEKNKAKPLSVREWFDKCQDAEFAAPSIKTYERDSKEAKAAHEEARRDRMEREVRKKEEAKNKREKSRLEKMKKENEKRMARDAAGTGKGDVPELDPPSSSSSRSSAPAKTPELEPFDRWYEEVDLKTAWLPKHTTEEDYTDEACQKLQEKYWKTMGLGEPSWYGADLMQGSLFVNKDTPWNVANLPNLLDRVNCVVPGVNEPYLYFGMWRATFAWHVEDMDLFSINYIHFGAPKYWYAIPQGQAEQLERFLANEFPIDSKACDQFIRHKSMAISPSRLREAGIRCNMLVHRQNEFVITYPKGYHAGFNMGFNCAESVNFALDSWIDYGRKAKHCQCVADSVRIDVEKMLAQAEDAVHQPKGVAAPKRNKDRMKEGAESGAKADEGGKLEGAEEKDETPRKRRKTKKGKVEIAGEDGPVDLQPIPAYAPVGDKKTKTIDISAPEPQHFAPMDRQPYPHQPMLAMPYSTLPLARAPPAAHAQHPARPPHDPRHAHSAQLHHPAHPSYSGYTSHPGYASHPGHPGLPGHFAHAAHNNPPPGPSYSSEPVAPGAQPPTVKPPTPSEPAQPAQSAQPAQTAQPDHPFTLSAPPAAKKAKNKAAPRTSTVTAPPTVYPCLFCPSLVTDDRLRVSDPNNTVKSQWRGGDAPVMVHIRCAQTTPEVGIEDLPGPDGKMETWVMGVNEIVKARWKLKCKVCDPHNESTGVKVQCTQGKCVQAFHFTCAEKDEKTKCALWQVEQQVKEDETKEDSPLITETFLKLELLCPAHNPEQKAIREQEKHEDIKRQLLAIVPGQSIKMKMGSAAVMCKLVRVLEQERMVEVDIDGVSQTVPWTKVDIKPAPPKATENEYARHHTHKRESLADVAAPQPAKATKTSKPPKAAKARPSTGSTVEQDTPADDVKQNSRRPSAAQSVPRQQDEIQPAARPQAHAPPAWMHQEAPRHFEAATLPPLPSADGAPRVLPILPPPFTSTPFVPSQHRSQAHEYPPYSAPHMLPPPQHPMPPPPGPPRSAPAASQPQLPHAASLPGFYAPPPLPIHRQVLHAPTMNQPPISNRVYVVDSHAPSHSPGYGYYDQQNPTHHYHLPPLRPQYPTHTFGQQYQYGTPPSTGYGHPTEHGYAGAPVPAPYADRRRSGGPADYPPQPPQPLSYAHAQGHANQLPSPQHFGSPHQLPLAQHAHEQYRSQYPQPPQQFSQPKTPTVPPPLSAQPILPTPPANAQKPGIDLGLERMRQMMSRLDPLTTPAIHLAGTNGKGSVSAMLESALRAAGMRVGRYNSPHLLEPRDAVRINGEPISAVQYNEAIAKIKRIGGGLDLTSFETATAAALNLINGEKVDVMIIECGMGGARDATNVLPSECVIATGLTAVGLDHTAFLGNTIDEITSDKAQIAVKDGIMVVGVQPFRLAYDTAGLICHQRGAKLVYTLSSRTSKPASGIELEPFIPPTPPTIAIQIQDLDGRFQDLPIKLPLPGAHQVDNLALVVTLLDAVRSDPRALKIQGKLKSMTNRKIQEGIAKTRWEGRCSWLSHPHFGAILLDGAHNADSATTLRKYIDSLKLSTKASRVPITFVLGLSESKGKAPESVLAPLLHTGDGVAVVGFSDVDDMPWVKPVPKETVERAAMGLKKVDMFRDDGAPSTFAKTAATSSLHGQEGAEKLEALAKALEWAQKRKGLTVVCGSLYLVADAYRLLGQEGQ